MYYSLLSRSSFDWRLGYFQLSAVTKIAAVDLSLRLWGTSWLQPLCAGRTHQQFWPMLPDCPPSGLFLFPLPLSMRVHFLMTLPTEGVVKPPEFSQSPGGGSRQGGLNLPVPLDRGQHLCAVCPCLWTVSSSLPSCLLAGWSFSFCWLFRPEL